MPRAALSEDDVEQFRSSLCDVAFRLFARDGYAGVTLRALAAELGCSPMTPYRYFENKQAIFDAVREAAFDRFADAQSEAADRGGEPLDRLRELGRAYARFALDEPYAYRIMFELDPTEAGGSPEHLAAEHRSWRVMRDTVGEAVECGALAGDPDTLAHLFWSGMHGLVTLHLAGKLQLGRSLETLIEAYLHQQLDPEHDQPPRLYTAERQSPTKTELEPTP
jgi:AcrR family transcriptional regulator